MTIVVMWYRERHDEVWCAADSRISSGSSIHTDSGPKILSVPVRCYTTGKKQRFKLKYSFNFGFAFSGSTLSALGTHSIASASTQNLLSEKRQASPISVKSVAELYRNISEHYIKDICARLSGALSDPSVYYFKAFIFGFCPIERLYKGFQIVPTHTDYEFKVNLIETALIPHRYHPMGSGANDFVQLSNELMNTQDDPGVIPTLREMFNRQSRSDVGGYYQLGVASKKGFQLIPIFDLTQTEFGNTVHFLGWDVENIGRLEGYRIGFKTVSFET